MGLFLLKGLECLGLDSHLKAPQQWACSLTMENLLS